MMTDSVGKGFKMTERNPRNQKRAKLKIWIF